MADNTITIVGNLTRDPELRYTTGGRGIASFGVAVNRRYQQNGEWQEQVSFFNVTAWADLGENVSASLGKGDRVVVTGRLEQRSWDDSNGEKRTAVEIVADEVGAAMRFAQVSISRNQRDGGSAGGRGSGRGSGRGGGGQRRPDPVYGDEEPF